MSEPHAPSVLDASALLALLHAEPGAPVVEDAVERAVISAVNWSEVQQRRVAHGVDGTGLRADVEGLGVAIEPFTAEDAEQAAELWAPTRSLGLSLADRACLALALRLGRPALTADRAWLELDVGVEIRSIR
ncbi:MAG TPA: type II toxin-antitoxin system VapC family toxin [Gaiellaceae bacterium]|nr:type II toxin-antitoxin system VapC family toxin [Gaiellaceae bacterium]